MFLLFIIHMPEEPFLVFTKLVALAKFNLSWDFSIYNCISAHPGNALVALTRYSSTFPSLVCLSLVLSRLRSTELSQGGLLIHLFPLPLQGMKCFCASRRELSALVQLVPLSSMETSHRIPPNCALSKLKFALAKSKTLETLSVLSTTPKVTVLWLLQPRLPLTEVL